MSGGDIGKGMLYGAVIGAAFATITSGIESIRNAKDGFRFGTNMDRFNSMVRSGKYQESLDFMSNRFNGPSMTVGDETITNLKTGQITISKNVFNHGPKAIRTAISHEWGHYFDDIVFEPIYHGRGDVVDFDIRPADHVGQLAKRYAQIGDLTMSGYNHAIKNAGKFHVGLKWIKGGTQISYGAAKNVHRFFPYNAIHWNNYGIQKWFNLIPKRF